MTHTSEVLYQQEAKFPSISPQFGGCVLLASHPPTSDQRGGGKEEEKEKKECTEYKRMCAAAVRGVIQCSGPQPGCVQVSRQEEVYPPPLPLLCSTCGDPQNGHADRR